MLKDHAEHFLKVKTRRYADELERQGGRLVAYRLGKSTGYALKLVIGRRGVELGTTLTTASDALRQALGLPPRRLYKAPVVQRPPQQPGRGRTLSVPTSTGGLGFFEAPKGFGALERLRSLSHKDAAGVVAHGLNQCGLHGLELLEGSTKDGCDKRALYDAVQDILTDDKSALSVREWLVQSPSPKGIEPGQARNLVNAVRRVLIRLKPHPSEVLLGLVEAQMRVKVAATGFEKIKDINAKRATLRETA